ncbi:Glucosamine--fructose-6-phosphate aminotransferase [isomerizing] 2 [Tupaia chinensis]|uniref:glutamine--fructose-6-phosphate transaminase (isomerizing) n=1 Tax=Tupaia chinensis TaxID=246437 RepID=L9KVA7_TUPCH|nr:Glucosamine--fructose-6-phosphate aminotransferase [isomerizing] 2 [Tupaia chinensis]
MARGFEASAPALRSLHIQRAKVSHSQPAPPKGQDTLLKSQAGSYCPGWSDSGAALQHLHDTIKHLNDVIEYPSAGVIEHLLTLTSRVCPRSAGNPGLWSQLSFALPCKGDNVSSICQVQAAAVDRWTVDVSVLRSALTWALLSPHVQSWSQCHLAQGEADVHMAEARLEGQGQPQPGPLHRHFCAVLAACSALAGSVLTHPAPSTRTCTRTGQLEATAASVASTRVQRPPIAVAQAQKQPYSPMCTSTCTHTHMHARVCAQSFMSIAGGADALGQLLCPGRDARFGAWALNMDWTPSASVLTTWWRFGFQCELCLDRSPVPRLALPGTPVSSATRPLAERRPVRTRLGEVLAVGLSLLEWRIFAYMNYRVPRTRREIFETLIKGLQRLEYRGYDSAGVAIDGHSQEVKGRQIQLVKKQGKVTALDEELHKQDNMDLKVEFETHFGLAHTRWATHGVPNAVNSHPQRSDKGNEFVVIHNGIITNYKDLKKFLESKGYEFESETDTEAIAKLIKYVFDHREAEDGTFSMLAERVIQQLEGAFALVFKSIHYPGEAVATRRGSPLLIGVHSKYKLSTEEVPIVYRTCNIENAKNACKSRVKRLDSTTCLHAEGDKAVEFFFASDASAIIEHTNRVIFLEDDDIAAVADGKLSIHRVKRSAGDDPSRAIQTLQMELQHIMRGRARVLTFTPPWDWLFHCLQLPEGPSTSPSLTQCLPPHHSLHLLGGSLWVPVVVGNSDRPVLSITRHVPWRVVPAMALGTSEAMQQLGQELSILTSALSSEPRDAHETRAGFITSREGIRYMDG